MSDLEDRVHLMAIGTDRAGIRAAAIDRIKEADFLSDQVRRHVEWPTTRKGEKMQAGTARDLISHLLRTAEILAMLARGAS